MANSSKKNVSNDDFQDYRGLGERLKSLRRDSGLSAQNVAESAGISRSFLSQIEAGTANPSVGTLRMIANVYNIPLVELFGDGEFKAEKEKTPEKSQLSEVRVIKKDNRKSLGWPNRKGMTYLLTPDVQHRLEVILSTLAPGEGSGEENYSHEGEEFGFVLEGIFEVTVLDQAFVLEPGDSIFFSSRLPHKTRVLGNTSATTLWVITPPTF